MIIPIHVKSHYSLGYGTASVEDLVHRAADLGLPALGLTDHENLYGQVRFHDLCRRRGVRAITGVELRPGSLEGREPGARSGRVVLVARDRMGYENLCGIISRRRRAAGSKEEWSIAADPVRAVGGRVAGLFALTDDPDVLEGLIEAVGVEPDRAGALLVRPSEDPGRESRLRETAARLGVPVVADPEVELLAPEDQSLHLLLLAIRLRERVAAVEGRADTAVKGRWFRSPGELAGLFADVPDAIEANARIAESCDLSLGERSAPIVPGAAIAADRSEPVSLDAATRAALEAARHAGRCLAAVYEDRRAAEVAAIESLGYAGYFLAAAEIARAARERGIPIAVRGSAVSSLAVHLLGISDIDPVERGLMFERFLNERRQAPPDIDIDVASDRRDELIRWTYRRFGRDRVAMVGAHHMFRARSAAREGLKALGVGRARVERFVARWAGRDPVDPERTPEGEAAERHPPLELLPPGARRSWPLVRRLVGKPRHLALHPGGVVIADREIDAYVPVERAPRRLSMAQYEMTSIERIGLVKIDLLGNRFLTQMQETARSVARGTAEASDPEACDPEPDPGIPLDDPATLRRIDRADTIGCFQIETPAVRALLERVRIGSIDDCVAVLALVRPGAAAGRTKLAYVRRVHGEEPDQPVHPLIADRLRETRGLLLYDEDLMAVIRAVTGASLSAADEMRSAIIDSADDRPAMERLERRFLDRAREEGTEMPLARAAWATVVRFAAYSFSKAHAWSYATLAYRSAYLKEHHPVEFGCALLNSYGGAYPLRSVAADLARSGVRVLGPSVNESEAQSRIVREDGRAVVRVGLRAIKHLSRKTAVRMLESRAADGSFVGVADLLERVQPARRETEALVLCGACDGLPPLSETAYPWVHEALLDGLRGDVDGTTFERIVRGSFEFESASEEDEADSAGRYRSLVRIRNELEYLDMHLHDHPMRVLRAPARRHGCLTSEALRERAHDGSADFVRFAGVLAASRRHPLGGGRAMQFLTLEDEYGLIEARIEPPIYPRLAPRITTPGPYLVVGRPESDRGHVSLVISDLFPFHEREETRSSNRQGSGGR